MQAYHHKLIHHLEKMNLTYGQIGELTLSSERRVQRWVKSRTPPEKIYLQQLERVTKIIKALRGLINPKSFNEWFLRPNRFLGKSPYQAIIDGDYEKLNEFILTTREGVFA
jgi:hypothetical protein